MRHIAIIGLVVALVDVPFAGAQQAGETAQFAVGAQYGTTHVYVAEPDMERFAASFIATFGGRTTPPAVVTVTPTPSKSRWQAIITPVGAISLFGFETPIPYPFGLERTGYLVSDMDAAVSAVQKDGAAILVAPFPDAIGRDVVVQWPGGVNMQFYWHTQPPSAPSLKTVPENRIYLAPDRAADFIRSFVGFARAKIVSDNPAAPGVEIGRPGETYRRIRIGSGFGMITLLVTDGHLPYPYGHEIMGYEVADVAETIEKAKEADVAVLVEPYQADGRDAAVLQFPGGYIAEIHSAVK